jgi:TolB protein
MRGRLLIPLVALGGFVVGGLAWPAPAGAAFPGSNGRIVFGSLRTGTQALFTMKPDGSGVRQLTHFGTNFQTAVPSWSPDGAHVVFQAGPDFRERDIWVIDADGSNAHRVFKDPWFFDGNPSYSPDGKSIVFFRGVEESASIWRVDVDGTHLTQLTPQTNDVFDGHPQYSPDGSRIAFNSFNRDGVIGAVYVMRWDGSHIRRLTPARLGAADPNWSPDGSRITFFIHCCAPKTDEIWAINADGTGLQRLTQPAPSNDFDGVYSPTGNKIAFERDTPDFSSSSVFVMKADGTGLVDIQDDAYQPSWQPVP